jgi:hypothetical protein
MLLCLTETWVNRDPKKLSDSYVEVGKIVIKARSKRVRNIASDFREPK